MSRMRGVCAAVDISIHAHIAAATTRLPPCIVMFRHSLSAVGIVSGTERRGETGIRGAGLAGSENLGEAAMPRGNPAAKSPDEGLPTRVWAQQKRPQRVAAGRAGCPGAEGVP